jgi:hypothetical protein
VFDREDCLKIKGASRHFLSEFRSEPHYHNRAIKFFGDAYQLFAYFLADTKK